ncbi:MAG: GNAT family N-acetyltransferase [Thermoproteales archaeon]|nr:GNAT family N-acetyltransferase [Thermoproteales archaeon]
MYCFLEVLVVHKDFRRRGIGIKLVTHCLNYVKKACFEKWILYLKMKDLINYIVS